MPQQGCVLPRHQCSIRSCPLGTTLLGKVTLVVFAEALVAMVLFNSALRNGMLDDMM
jgi:hypothetical protein